MIINDVSRGIEYINFTVFSNDGGIVIPGYSFTIENYYNDLSDIRGSSAGGDLHLAGSILNITFNGDIVPVAGINNTLPIQA